MELFPNQATVVMPGSYFEANKCGADFMCCVLTGKSEQSEGHKGHNSKDTLLIMQHSQYLKCCLNYLSCIVIAELV